LRGNLSEDAIWAELAGYLRTRFWHSMGFERPIDGCAIDSGGHYTQRVYKFIHSRPMVNIFGIKGRGVTSQKWLERSDSVRSLWLVAVDVLKRSLYDMLAIQTPGPGFVHIPAARDYLWCVQLVSEKAVMRKINGIPMPRFELPGGSHNEALDARVYARCAVEILKPAWNLIEERYKSQTGYAAKEDKAQSVERLRPQAVAQSTRPDLSQPPAFTPPPAPPPNAFRPKRRITFGRW
jgi:phage terminase large subunit GpA-like protein